VAVRPSLRPFESEKEDEVDGLSQDGEAATMEEQEDLEELDREEAQEPKIRRAPKEPTRAERERHEALHLPYREWCRHCVRGRGRNRPHRAEGGRDKDENQVSRVSMDYFFMSQEEEQASKNPLMVMIDEKTQNRYMRAVGQKGLGAGNEMDWIIKDMHEELKSWGHPGGGDNELILKSDGEPAIRAVREKLATYHGGKITPEQPPTGESQSNGKVEEAGKTVRSMAKVFKDMIEERTGGELASDSKIIHWLVRWVAMLYSRYKIGTDGKTAYERQKGRKCKMEVVPFGEKVMFKRLKVSGEKKQSMESKWEDGLWLGHARASNETLIGTREGVVRAWAVKRKLEEDGWDKELIEEMAGTPDRPNPHALGNYIPIKINLPKNESDEKEESKWRRARQEEAPRRTHLKKDDFLVYGYTDGCKGCRWIQKGIGRPGRNDKIRERV